MFLYSKCSISSTADLLLFFISRYRLYQFIQ